MPKKLKCNGQLIQFSPGEITIEAAPKVEGEGEEKGPLKLTIAAYNGGIMTVGYYGPIVADTKGMSLPGSVALLAGHDNRIEASLGGGKPKISGGKLAVAAQIARKPGLRAETIDLLEDGIPLQASVGLQPIEVVRYEAGEKVKVNGQSFVAPQTGMVLIAKSRLQHVAILPNGADWSTEVNIAAEAGSAMTFEQWLKAKGFEGVNAEQQTALRELYERSQSPVEGGQAEGNGPGAGTPPASGTTPPVNGAQTPPAESQGGEVSAVLQVRAAMAAETKRVNEIRSVCGGTHAKIEAQAISEGWDENRTALAVLHAERSSAGPAIHIAGQSANVEASAVIEAALCNRVGLPNREKLFKEEVLAESDRIYRGGMGLQELLLQAAQANGYTGRPVVSGSTVSAVFRAAFRPAEAAFSTISLPDILSNLANKELLAGFEEQDQTWREVAAIKSASDFKEHTSHRMLGNVEYEELEPDGTIKHGTLSEEKYKRKVRTYAKMLSLTREHWVNDDMDAFEQLRTVLGAGYGQRLNRVVWTTVLANLDNLFTAELGNRLTGSDTELGLDGTALQKAILAFRKLKASNGMKPPGGPAILLVPPEYESVADQIYKSHNINTGGASTIASVPNENIHKGKYRPVVAEELSDEDYGSLSTKHWFLLRKPQILAAVAVSFLDGRDMPMVEVGEPDFDTLGVKIRGWGDFGADPAEPLAGVMCDGE